MQGQREREVLERKEDGQGKPIEADRESGTWRGRGRAGERMMDRGVLWWGGGGGGGGGGGTSFHCRNSRERASRRSFAEG